MLQRRLLELQQCLAITNREPSRPEPVAQAPPLPGAAVRSPPPVILPPEVPRAAAAPAARVSASGQLDWFYATCPMCTGAVITI